MAEETKLSNKNFVVVGASSGIGRQVAMNLSDLNANVLAIGRDEARLKELKRYYPSRIFTQVLDVVGATEKTWSSSLEHFTNSHGKIHGGVYTAGIWGITPLDSFDVELAHKIFDTSFWGAVNFLQTATKKKFSHQMSTFVLMSSVAGDYPSKGLFAYSAAKAALQAAVQSFAKEIISNGHRVNSVAPALVQTEMMQNDMATMAYEMISKHILGICEPEDVSEMIVFLLSDRAKKITGHNFAVDGGYVAGAMI